MPDLSPRALIQSALTSLLKRNPSALAQLARHAGKTFAMVALPFKGLFTIEHDGQLAYADPAIMPDVTIEIDLSRVDWPKVVGARAAPDLVSLPRVTGDAGLAQTLSNLLQTLRPDIEDLLAERVGDIAARQLVQTAKGLQQGVVRSGQRAAENIAEYLSYETNILTPQVALADFASNLQAVHQRLQSLATQHQQLSLKIDRITAQNARVKGHKND